MLAQAARADQYQRQQQARHEAADVRPERHPRTALAQRAAQQLEEEPVAEHEQRRHRDRGDVEAQEDQHVHVCARIHARVCAQHAADGARSADHRHGAGWIRGDLRTGCRQSRQQVEQQEARQPHDVLDVVAEHPQEPHVADDVEPAAVHEHRAEQVEPAAATVDHAGKPGTERHLEARRHQPQQIRRNQPVQAQRARQRAFDTETLHEEPREDVERDDQHGAQGPAQPHIVVVERKHAAATPPRRTAARRPP